MEEFLQAAMDKCDSHVEGAGGIKEVIKEWLTTSLMTMTDLAQVVNEAPMAPKEKVGSPTFYVRYLCKTSYVQIITNLKSFYSLQRLYQLGHKQ